MASLGQRWREWPGTNKRSLAAVGVALLVVVGLLGLRNCVTDKPLDRLSKSTSAKGTVYEGSWHFPRGGPYVVGFVSSAGAELYIDGRLTARGRGQKLKRVVKQAGVVAVRIVSRGSVRLLWHPPGRRGPPEYVPPSSLSPDPPKSASFTRPGRSVGDGMFALLIVFTLVGLFCYIWRDALRQVDRRVALCCAAVFVFAFVIRLIDLNGAGQTWDEDVNWSAGRNYITNVLALDFDQSSWLANYEHPPMMKYVAGIGAQFTDGYAAARALSALLVALACALLIPIGRRLFSLRVGILAGVIAALTPHLIAHSKVVGHEAPTVLLWTVIVWLCLRAHDPAEDDEHRTRTLAIRFGIIGVVLGLAIMSRFVNVLAAPLIGLLLLLQAPVGERKKTLLLGISVIPVVAVIVSFIVWPRLWSTPIDHMQQSWNKLKKPHSLEPFLGTLTNTPPRYYFAVYLFATAPVGILLGVFAWFGRVAADQGLPRKSVVAWLARGKTSAVLALWLAVPMIVMMSPVRQDGVRYIMPCLVVLALISAAGLDFFVSSVSKFLKGRDHQLFVGASAGMTLYLLISVARIHPYYLNYYNEVYGGPAGVAKSKAFEVAWWGEGLGEALGYINRHAKPGDRVYKRWVEPSHLAWLRGDLWKREARNPARADWILLYRPSWKHCGHNRFCPDPPYKIPPGFTVAYSVTAQGAVLARVYKRTSK